MSMTVHRDSDRLPKVAVVGAGAVGSYFGGMLARAGADVTLLGRPQGGSVHLEAIGRDGLLIDGVTLHERVAIGVDRIPNRLPEADLVLFAVKTTATAEAAASIAPHLAPRTIVVSLQNGVDNVERMAAAGVRALPSVVFVAAEIETPGSVRHRGRGDLLLPPSTPPEHAETVAGWFEAASVPCQVSDAFAEAQWTKLTINAMANAISALTCASYRAMAEYPPTWELAVRAAQEAAEVARCSGVAIDVDQAIETMRGIAASVGEATSSTEQDIARGRPTEIDALNGAIARRGRELGLATPIHDALTALVGLRERRES